MNLNGIQILISPILLKIFIIELQDTKIQQY